MVSCLFCFWGGPSGGGEGYVVPGLKVKLLSPLSVLLSRRGEKLLCFPGNFLLGAHGKTQD